MRPFRVPNKVYEPDDKEFNRTKFQLPYVPDNMQKQQCLECGCLFELPWLEKRSPLTSIKSHNGCVWRRRTVMIECPDCKYPVEHELPHQKAKGKYGFFGDEASRITKNELIFTLSVVGCDHIHLERIESLVHQFKIGLEPDRPADTWTLHMTKLRSGQQRKKDPIFGNWSDAKVMACIDGLFKLIDSFGPYFIMVNATGVLVRPSSKKEIANSQYFLQQEVYAALLMDTIDISTKNSIKPYFIFDSVKDSAAETIVHEWARDAFLGSQQSLLYAHLTHGIDIPEPEFVKPASRPLLEIADFVSYVIARYLYCRFEKVNIDLDPVRLGEMKYIGFDHVGDLITTGRHQVGFPWNSFWKYK
ncbi:DUF3800 domain-containing protein [Aeromonas rivipollensis]|uniref:DUF3800 domain-containing protein n=1 Tax=Aeromonas rivipollensis TaxID=948519 RepID=A0ABX0CYZ0_9GAMM|nr:DUF3800 domain-containing protein [Aeromonas rivipollensis]NEX89142.1 DUF3800 domain-containing protein [Aeromonas rivipollensis]NEY05008.1 DUF3800 domain-containing protein [Aeromonas rivipollensis]